MSRIVVFDSGFGSLSVIQAIQKHTRANIIYFADQKNFPYGKKSRRELERIITQTISKLKEKFRPDLVIVGSNTPSLLLNDLFLNDPTVIGVLPPLLSAQQLTKTNSIAMLATSSVVKSSATDDFIKRHQRNKIKILKIDSSDLVELVESGKFIYKKNQCIRKIISILYDKFHTNDIDVATLSSTHLPFLLPLFQEIFPHVKFLDPANDVAMKIKRSKLFSPSKRNSFKIFTSGNVKKFQNHLHAIGIKKSVQQINL
ncbi:MAG: glutamate racemase [Thermoproteota archaeon]